MSCSVSVRFTPLQAFELRPRMPMDAPTARGWLDAEYQRLACEPSRASGKILLADKLLSIAEAAGPAGFGDAAWATRFADAAAGALSRPAIRVDVAERTVGY